MLQMITVDLLGYTGGVLTAVSLIPQVIQSWKTRSTKDLSMWRYLTYAIGLSLWVTYAFIIHNNPILIMMGLELLLALSVLYLKFRHG